MAGQGLFVKAWNLVANSRLLLNNRIYQISAAQVSGIKNNAADKLKELKVPDKPKRPLTPYFKFVQDKRGSLMKQHPNWKVTEITKECASVWKTIDPTLKDKYDREYKAELEVYSNKYLEYSKKLTDVQKEALKNYSNQVKNAKIKRQRKKKLRANNKPKRPMGAYMLYVMDQAKGQDKSYPQLLSDLKGQWAALPDDKKIKYTTAAAKAKEQYDQELNLWELKMIEEGNEDIVRATTLAKKTASE